MKILGARRSVVSPAADPGVAAIGIPLSGFISVQRLTDTATGAPLEKRGRVDALGSRVAEVGTPTSYWQTATGLQFNAAPPVKRTYWMEYYSAPEPLTAALQEPAIPAVWHEAIILWVLWWGRMRDQDWQGQYATSRIMEETVQRIKQQSETSLEFDDITVEIVL